MFNNHGDKVLLATVQQLTFRRGRMTTSRRTRAIPQLVCDDSGSAGCPRQKKYQFPKAVCDNIGIGANGQPMWACTVDNLPPGVWLGQVMVSCEGYDRSTDPYILRGSCSLTYALDGNGPDEFSFPGFLVFMIAIFCCCCLCCRKKGHKRQRGCPGTTLSIPAPAYQADYVNATPVLATAVPSNEDFNSKTTDMSSFSQATYDPEMRPEAYAPVDSGVPDSSRGSTGGVAKTAAAVGAATAAVAATNQIASVDNTLPHGWEARVDYTTGRTYYVDHVTRQTTWTHPASRTPAEQHFLLPQNYDGSLNTNTGWGGGWGIGWPMGQAAGRNANVGTTAYGGTHNKGAEGGAMEGGGTTIGGTQNRGGEGGGAGSSTAVGGTQNRTDSGGWKWLSGWGGSSTAVGGTHNRGWDAGSGGDGGRRRGGGFGGTSNR